MPSAAATLTALVEAAESDPTTVVETRADGDALATEVGGELALRWGICAVRSLISDPPDGDAVREAYSELVDRYRGDRSALDRLKPLGDEIRKLEADGTLPSAMVARSDRRKR
ncbi:MAG TPA: hypothetical protein VGM39_06960 [Kofleriaceae bacterium]|jgi:hypothetical protein